MTPTITAALVLALVTGPSSRERWRSSELAVRAPPPAIEFEEVEQTALQYLGRPYVMGGVGSPGFDCSGFVCRVYAESGYAIPRVSRDQARVGASVPLDAIRPGDLLFFADDGRPISHVGMYLGDGELVHASTGQGKIVVARLASRWFADRLVAARRVLTSTSGEQMLTPDGPIVSMGPTVELVEHRGETMLPPMLMRPARRSAPSYGPNLVGADGTSLRLRSAVVSEAGTFGFAVVPEATLTLESIAFTAAVAVPIRIPFDDRPTLGTFDSFGDYTRFIRRLSLGVEDADLELAFSRFDDVSLLSGFVVDHLAPASETRGVPGLTAARSALTFFGRVRTDWVAVEGLVDDVVDPAILGLGARVPLPVLPLSVGVALATDQRAQFSGGRRTVNALEAEVRAKLVDQRQWSVDAHLDVGIIGALGESGAGTVVVLEGERRLSSGSAVTLELEAGYAGPRFVSNMFGPTYAHERRVVLESLAATEGRTLLAGAITLRFGKILAKAGYGQSVGAHRAAIDRRLEAVLEAEAISWFGTRLLDLRAVYAARAPFSDETTIDTIHGGARLRLASWLFLEAYVEKGRALESGLGATVAWSP